ncbi:MAG: 2-hydroxyacid dehydrogenase [Desulfobacteraceae bacterium]
MADHKTVEKSSVEEQPWRPSVFVTRPLPPAVMEALESDFELVCNPEDRVLTREELLSGVKGRDAVLSLLTDRIDAEVMDAAGPGLRIIANYAVGYDNIDLEAATERKIAVSNTPGVLTETTADLAMGMILAVARRIVEGDSFVRAGRFRGWGPLLYLGADIHGKTLGLIGLGRIGRAVAKRAAGFDMRILYCKRTRADSAVEEELNVRYATKEELLRESDFVSLHVPSTPDTFHFIGEAEFDLMKPSAFIINTARGEVIDEAALVGALKDKRIAGAALDVFENEPEIHPGLIEMPNVILLPHVGSGTIETRTRMGLVDHENLKAFFQGKVPPNCLNPQVFG